MTKSVDEKWDEVKAYYEQFYGNYFQRRLNEQQIEYLYGQMIKLQCELSRFYQAAPALLQKVRHAAEASVSAIQELSHDR